MLSKVWDIQPISPAIFLGNVSVLQVLRVGWIELYQIQGGRRYTIGPPSVYFRFPICCSGRKAEGLKCDFSPDFVLFVTAVKIREGMDEMSEPKRSSVIGAGGEYVRFPICCSASKSALSKIEAKFRTFLILCEN